MAFEHFAVFFGRALLLLRLALGILDFLFANAAQLQTAATESFHRARHIAEFIGPCAVRNLEIEVAFRKRGHRARQVRDSGRDIVAHAVQSRQADQHRCHDHTEHDQAGRANFVRKRCGDGGRCSFELAGDMGQSVPCCATDQHGHG